MNPLNSNGNRNRPSQNNIMQMYSQVMNNPRAFLNQLGIPQNINTPQEAVQYLLQQGRTTQERINEAQAQAKQINIKV